MMTPQPHWRWFIRDDLSLCLSLSSELEFVTGYKVKQLTVGEGFEALFDSEHCEQFYRFQELFAEQWPGCEEAFATQIILNATAALCFHKPLGNKSWLFDSATIPARNDIFIGLQNKFGAGVGVRLDMESDFSTCIILTEDLPASEAKVLPQFSAVKISTDRFRAVSEKQLAGFTAS